MTSLHIPPEIIPANVDYQWSSISVAGDARLGDIEALWERGWRPVPRERHSALECAKHSQSTENIEVGGLLLVERPKIMTVQAQDDERLKAKMQRDLGRRVTMEDSLDVYRAQIVKKATATALTAWRDWLAYQARRPVIWARLRWIRFMDLFRTDARPR